MKRFFLAAFCLFGSALVGGAADSVPSAKPNPVVEIKTSKGVILAELFADKAPVTVANFLAYAEKKHYHGTVFHRVIRDFMIQGGGFAQKDGKTEQKEVAEPIKNEADNGLKNARGTLAMARTRAKDSATSQFFINTVNNNKLNLGDPEAVSPDGYAVFGKVIKGMDVVDAIAAVEVHVGSIVARTPDGLVEIPAQNMPKEQVVIESVTVKPAAETGKKPSGKAADKK